MDHLVQFVPYYPPHVGGVESYAQGLAAAWAASGRKSTVVTFSPGQPKGVREYEKDGVNVVVLPAWEIVGNFPFPKLWSPAFWAGLRRVRTSRPGAVLTHTRFFASAVVGGRFARSSGARWVHLEHGSGPVAGQSAAVKAFSRLWDATLGRWVLGNADALLAASAACRGFVTKLSGRNDVAVALQGVAVPDVPRRANAVPVVAYVGRLVALKGVDVLLRAAARVTKGVTAFELKIVGDGPERQALETLARELGLADRTEFLGMLPREKVLSEILPGADVFVNPSLQEGLPTTVVEAAASGCCIVATDVGGTREIAAEGPNFRLVPAGDEVALAAALEAALPGTDASVQARGVREKFGWGGAVAALSAAAGSGARKKLYLLVNSLEGGGAERVVANVAAELAPRHDVTVFTLKSGTFFDLPAGVALRPLSRARTVLGMLAALPLSWWRLRRELVRGKFDAGVSFLELANFLHVLARRNAAISFRTNVAIFKGLSGRTYLGLIRLLYPRAGAIVVNSQENRAALTAYLGLPQGRVATLYNPSDLGRAAALAAEPLDAALAGRLTGKRVFVTVGRLIASKRHALLLRGFAAAKATGLAGFKLLVVGDGPERAKLEALAAGLGLTGEIEFLGAQKNVFKFLKASGCFVYASQVEGFPNALIEAVTCGVPVVTTPFRTGAEEVVFGDYRGRDFSGNVTYGPNGAVIPEDGFVEKFARTVADASKLRSEGIGLEKFADGAAAWADYIQQLPRNGS